MERGRFRATAQPHKGRDQASHSHQAQLTACPVSPGNLFPMKFPSHPQAISCVHFLEWVDGLHLSFLSKAWNQFTTLRTSLNHSNHDPTSYFTAETWAGSAAPRSDSEACGITQLPEHTGDGHFIWYFVPNMMWQQTILWSMKMFFPYFCELLGFITSFTTLSDIITFVSAKIFQFWNTSLYF